MMDCRFGMNNIPLELRNMEAICKISHQRQETPDMDLDDCPLCEGTGMIKGTETKDLWGVPCGCGRGIDWDFVKRRMAS